MEENLKKSLKDIIWTDCDPDDTHYDEVYPVVRKAAYEMMKNEFPEVLVSTFLHKLVEIAIYDAGIELL